MAALGSCRVAGRAGTCNPLAHVNTWDKLDEQAYDDTTEVDYLRFIVGIVYAIEAVGRWE